MKYFEELVEPLFGAWTAGVLVLTLLVIWAVKTVPGWLSNRRDALRGSPSSPKYWRSRLAEAIEQHRDTIDDGERSQLRARITEARIMVEAHEAKRRVGIGGVVPLWLLVGFFGLAAAITWASAMVNQLPVAAVVAVVLGLLLIGAEILALNTSTAGTERLYALIAAGRFGHSDLVRSDPWLVLRTYDYWRSESDRRALIRQRVKDDKRRSTQWVRFERGLLGVGPRQSMAEIDHDIWARLSPDPVSVSTTPDLTSTSGTC
ncbi:hypothetical protein WDU99_02885 [Microbacterium sp. Mu-80]|uniref:DUF2207 domain-containing protein n=1 Tax=Microbacterium bandirmense TaxID=3122050 RepID=A0ABU8L8X9_9MICO